jgi:histidinol-phosphate aminotransferase
MAYLDDYSEVIASVSSFPVYDIYAHAMRASLIKTPTKDYGLDLEAMARAITRRTKLIFVCNPNNPTGTYVPSAEVKRLVERVPDDVMVVIDEAYIEFVTAEDREGSLQIQKEHDNVVVLRTFSKIYGLCGLRTGFGICAPEVKGAVDKVRQPFNVNLLGQLAAIEALKHQDQVAQRRETNAALRDHMAARLAARGRATLPTQANFMLVDTNDLCDPHDEVCGTLLSLGAIVRDGNALGCPGWARVTVGTHDEIEFFLEKLASLEVGAREDGEVMPS